MIDTAVSPDADAAMLAEALRHSVGRFVRAVRKHTDLAKSAQSETLALLDQTGAANVASLAHRRGVTHQTMRLVVAQLEASDLVAIEADPADGRSRLVSLSEAGRAELARVRAVRASAIDLMIRDLLSAEDRAVLRGAIALLERMSASIEV